MEIRLMRHLETDAQGRCIGHTDLELSEKGTTNLKTHAREAAAWRPDLIVSSDLQRCLKLALEIYQHCGNAFQTSALWREVDFGDWEGKTWDELQAGGSSEYHDWCENYVTATPPNGESFNALKERVNDAIDLVKDLNPTRALVVTHAGPIRALCSENLSKAFELEVPFGGTFEVPSLGK